MTSSLKVFPLSAAAFAPFGDVIEIDGAERLEINQGTCERFHDLAKIDVSDNEGQAIVSLFRAQPRPAPIRLEVMERHPLGSQVFFPLQDRDWLIVVAQKDSDPTRLENLHAFRATGRQGINYAKGVWHHPLLVLDPGSMFLVVDRKGSGNNLEEMLLDKNPYSLNF